MIHNGGYETPPFLLSLTNTMETNLSDGFENIADATAYGLFMTPVARYTNKNHIDHKTIIMEYIQGLQQVKNEPRPYISRGITQLGPDNVLEMPQLEPIKEMILDAVQKANKASYNYALDKISIVDSYIELTNEGGMYAPHEHSNVIYSGTYYINFDLQKHSIMKFRRYIGSPHYPVLQMNYTGQNAFNQLEAEIPHNEGDVIIHPPNIQHGYENNGHGNRIALSFNIAPF